MYVFYNNENCLCIFDLLGLDFDYDGCDLSNTKYPEMMYSGLKQSVALYTNLEILSES